MERLEIHITRDKKVKQGKGASYNSITIELNRIKEREYKTQIIKQIEQIEQKIDGLRLFNYTGTKQRKVINKVNNTPESNGFDRGVINVIERNEKARKQIEQIKELLK